MLFLYAADPRFGTDVCLFPFNLRTCNMQNYFNLSTGSRYHQEQNMNERKKKGKTNMEPYKQNVLIRCENKNFTNKIKYL